MNKENHMIGKALVTVSVAVLALALAPGCGGDDEDDGEVADSGSDTDSDSDSDSDTDSDSDADSGADTDPDSGADTDTWPEGATGFWGFLSYEDETVTEPLEGIPVCAVSGGEEYGCAETDASGMYSIDELPAFPTGCNLSANVCWDADTCYSGSVIDVQTSEPAWVRVDISLTHDQGK
jgi:hypothetical protein